MKNETSNTIKEISDLNDGHDHTKDIENEGTIAEEKKQEKKLSEKKTDAAEDKDNDDDEEEGATSSV